MRSVFGGRAGVALAFILGLAIAAGGTATASRLITGGQIKNGTIQAKDLSKGLRARIARAGGIGPQGPAGPQGPSGIGPAYRVEATPKGGGGALLDSTLPMPEITRLDLPAGSYAISARLSFGADLSATTAYVATCDLTAGSDVDRGRVIAQKDGKVSQVDTSLLHTFASPGPAVLSCGDALLDPAFWDRATITAIRVSSISVVTKVVG